MTQVNDVTYKGHILTATALSDQDMYAAMLLVRAPSGLQFSSGILGKFSSAIGAVRYAFAYGMAAIDYRQAPASDWLHASAPQANFDRLAARRSVVSGIR